MKKIVLMFALFVCILGYSQKKLFVYNYTSATVKIYAVHTKPVSGTYPKCFGYRVALAPGDALILENNSSTTKFPFYSPITTPSIINDLSWTKMTSATVMTSSIPGTTLWNDPIAPTQQFDYIDFASSYHSANGQIRTVPSVEYDLGTMHIIAERITTGVGPSDYEDVIVLTDL